VSAGADSARLLQALLRCGPAPRIHGTPRGPIVVALANPGSVRPALASHDKPAQRDPQASQTLAITA
jgi:hypothetical protein